jgi:hypothetical protein
LTPPPGDVTSGRIFIFYGDLRVLELEGGVPANTMFDLILYTRGNETVARQRVGKGGRYSFNNIIEGNYLIAVELDNVEIARVAIHVAQRKHEPIRRDLELDWTPSLRAKRGAPSVTDSYSRTPQKRKLFEKAVKQNKKKELAKAEGKLPSNVENNT